MIVRWGLESLPAVLAELGIERPLLVTSERWRGAEVPVEERFDGVRAHTPAESVAAAEARAAGSDGLVALGGGSAIDTAKAVSARTGQPVVSVPTTYSGAEWTSGFGVLDAARGVKVGGAGARVVGIVYEPELTLELPRSQSGGTAMNALAHCAEALYVPRRSEASDREALAGARLIARFLPRVLADGRELEARTLLLEGAAHAGAALAGAGMGLAHAMAQALGGRYGLPHGALNAVCLPATLRFNADAVPGALARFGAAMATDDPVARVEALARLAGCERLRDLGVPYDELDAVAEATVTRAGARANPRPASAEDVAQLLRSVW